jgi:hypothetical protein
MSADTDDHLLECAVELLLLLLLLAVLLLLLLALTAEAEGGTGCKTLSKNLTKGNSEATAAAVDGGELGNGRWMIVFAFGGGRTGNSLSSPLSPAPAPVSPFRSAQSASSICRCSSAALKCAVEGNGATS